MVKILVAGDLCPRDRGLQIVCSSEYINHFNSVKCVINNVDYSLVNLECPIVDTATPIKKQGPNPLYLKSINLTIKGYRFY